MLALRFSKLMFTYSATCQQRLRTFGTLPLLNAAGTAAQITKQSRKQASWKANERVKKKSALKSNADGRKSALFEAAKEEIREDADEMEDEKDAKEAAEPSSDQSKPEYMWAREFFKQPSSFLTSVSSIQQLDTVANPKLPEIAFIGRSNCGKSTLINSLLNQKKLVRTSKNPGHTRMLNFFKLGNEIMLVDMPGYGFNCRKEWASLVQAYIHDRKTLNRVCLLVDSRRGLMDLDKNWMKIFDKAGIPYQVILTKVDKLEDAETVKKEVLSYIEKKTASCFLHVLPVSAKKKTNLDELRLSLIEKLGVLKPHPL